MKVLFISSWYPSESNPLKGTFVQKHAEAIAAAGAEVFVLAICINPSERIFEKNIAEHESGGMKALIVDVRSKYYKIFYLRLFWQFRLLRKVYEEKIAGRFQPDLVHSNVIFPAGILAFWLSKRLKLPHVITEHWSRMQQFMKKSLYAGYGRKAYAESHFITTVSGDLKEKMAEFKSSNKVAVVPNVVNTTSFFFRDKEKVPGILKFICVAHWRIPKRPDLVFDSLQLLSAEIKERIHLTVVGEGELLEKLKGKNWSFEINYAGNKKAGELCSMLQESDFFLHGSDMETFSIVTAEALSTGTPALVSKVGALPELVNDSNGVLCDNYADSWIKGLKILIQKKYDHQKISEEINRFSREEVGKKFMEVYRKVLS